MMQSIDPPAAAVDGVPENDASSLERLKRFGGGKLLGEMIALFLSTAVERMAAARQGVETGDPKATEAALHSLKSSSAQLGAVQMQRLSERGERLANSGSLDGLDHIIRDLETEFPRVREWLERARNAEAP